tara:strand:- start:744 stop:1442 length:699 start_codon:yes stop_codon:yes gene_type:complete
MNYKKISLIVVVILIIYFTYKYIQKNLNYAYVVLNKPSNAKLQITVPADKMLFSQPEKGLSFSTSFWIFIKNWEYKLNKEKIILYKGGFKLYLEKNFNNLVLEMPVFDSNKKERITYTNIPVQKWLHIVITLENRYLDLWINGKLYYAKHLSNFPKIFESKDSIFTPNGGFSGYLSKIQHYEYPLDRRHILYLFHLSPLVRNPFVKIWDRAKKVVGSVKLDVNINVETDCCD